MEDVIPPKPTEPAAGTCDWGRCNRHAVTWRYSKAIRIWLPVCDEHEHSVHPR